MARNTSPCWGHAPSRMGFLASTIPSALLTAEGRGWARGGCTIRATGPGRGKEQGQAVVPHEGRYAGSLAQVGRGLSLVYLLLPPSQAVQALITSCHSIPGPLCNSAWQRHRTGLARCAWT